MLSFVALMSLIYLFDLGLHPGTLGVDLSLDLAAGPGQTKVEAGVKNCGEAL